MVPYLLPFWSNGVDPTTTTGPWVPMINIGWQHTARTADHHQNFPLCCAQSQSQQPAQQAPRLKKKKNKEKTASSLLLAPYLLHLPVFTQAFPPTQPLSLTTRSLFFAGKIPPDFLESAQRRVCAPVYTTWWVRIFLWHCTCTLVWVRAKPAESSVVSW